MNSSRWQKGHIPFNKGKKLSPETIEKVKKNNAHYWLGKKMPEYIGEKIRQKKLGKKRNITWGDNLSKALMGHKPSFMRNHTEGEKSKIADGIQKAQERIIEEIKEFEKQGFRCVPTGGKVIPDFIAIKDNKVYAVEVEYGRHPNYSKYTDEVKSYVDDVIWILKKETSTTTIRTVKKTEDIV